MSRQPSRPAPRAAATAVLSGALLLGTLGGQAAHADPEVPPVQALTAASLVMHPASAGWLFSTTANRTQNALMKGLGMWRAGEATTQLDVSAELAADGGAQLVVTVGADRCNGGADMTVSIDGTPVLQRTVDVDHGVIPVPGRLAAGAHKVAVAYSGDVVTDSCDRALKVYGLSVYAGGAAPDEVVTFGPPSLLLSNPAAGLWHDLVGGQAETVIWSSAEVSRRFTSGDLASAQIVVSAAGDACEGPAQYETFLDGTSLGRTDATAVRGAYAQHVLAGGPLAAGQHEVRVAFVNDLLTPACDRNLRLRTVAVHG